MGRRFPPPSGPRELFRSPKQDSGGGVRASRSRSTTKTRRPGAAEGSRVRRGGSPKSERSRPKKVGGGGDELALTGRG